MLRGFPAVTCLEIIAFFPLQPVGVSLNCGSPKSHAQAGGDLSCRAGLQTTGLQLQFCENTLIKKKKLQIHDFFIEIQEPGWVFSSTGVLAGGAVLLVSAPVSLYTWTWGSRWSHLDIKSCSTQHCGSAGQEKAPNQRVGI